VAKPADATDLKNEDGADPALPKNANELEGFDFDPEGDEG
jgi:hypothetical protein